MKVVNQATALIAQLHPPNTSAFGDNVSLMPQCVDRDSIYHLNNVKTINLDHHDKYSRTY